MVLGHLQRGGSPSAYDRVLATRLGLAAARLVAPEAIRDDGRPLRQSKIIDITLCEGVAAIRTLDLSYYDEAAAFFQ